jgi:hypothetical protein
VSKVLNKLSEKGLKVNIKKCLFAQSQVKYLGHLISKDGIKPYPEMKLL